MCRKVTAALFLSAVGVLGIALSAGAQASVTLVVHIRDVAGNPVAGIGVHLYAADFDNVTLVDDQVTDASGSVAFSVVPYGSYSVAIYAPEGFSGQVIPEDQQYLPGMGDLGLGGTVGIGVVMGAKDYTLRLVLQEGRPYHDRSLSDQELPEPYIPGLTDRGWPTPTPWGPVPAAGLTAGPTVGPAAPVLSQPTRSAPDQPEMSIRPAPFPWGPVLAIAGLAFLTWVGYRLHAHGSWAKLAQKWRRWRRGRRKSAQLGDRK